jgi:hypothetical protein
MHSPHEVDSFGSQSEPIVVLVSLVASLVPGAVELVSPVSPTSLVSPCVIVVSLCVLDSAASSASSSPPSNAGLPIVQAETVVSARLMSRRVMGMAGQGS